MPFVDKWGTSYPDDLKTYVEKKEIIDSNDGLKSIADAVTRGARTTDEAIMKIHGFAKTSLGTGHVPLIFDIPVRRASDQLKCGIGERTRNLCVQKTIMETALLRSQGIPSRVAVSFCGTHTSRLRFSPILQAVQSVAPWLATIPVVPHAYTEVYAEDEGGEGKFRRKDSYINEKHCKHFEGSCLEEQEKQWKRNKDIPDIQDSLNCIYHDSYDDFPKWLALYVNVPTIVRESTQIVDILDPIPQ